MPSRRHQSLTTLLVEHPELLVDLVRRRLGVKWPEDLELAAGPETVRARGSERVADGAVVLRRRGGTVLETLVVEIQLRKDAHKRKAWAIYVTGTWARLGCPATLVVVTVSRTVAQWAARPIDIGRRRMVLRPLVIGPDRIPAVMSLADARAWPERLALSVLTHGQRTPGQKTPGQRSGSLRLARTALTVAHELLALGDHRSMVLADVLVRFLNERVRRTVEAEMKIEGEVFHTTWGKAYGRMRAQALAEGWSKGMAEGMAEGQAKGMAEGRFEGMAKALWAVLRGRGLEPTKGQRERIERCRSAKQLESWIGRAMAAKTVAEVFRRSSVRPNGRAQEDSNLRHPA
jgi:hypothetical protein